MPDSFPENDLPKSSPKKQPVFIHPIEAAFARILDFYGVAWDYEPRSFPLKWDKNGKVIEAFRPDFYLPGQDLYVELTTLRPSLTRRKNSKLKRIKEMYPDINIKLFKRRELRNMMIRFGLIDEAARIFGDEAQRAEED